MGGSEALSQKGGYTNGKRMSREEGLDVTSNKEPVVGLFTAAENGKAFSQGPNTYVHALLDVLLQHTQDVHFKLILNRSVVSCFDDVPEGPRISKIVIPTVRECGERASAGWRLAHRFLSRAWLHRPKALNSLRKRLYFDPEVYLGDAQRIAFLSYNMTNYWLVGFRPYVVAVHDLRFLHIDADGKLMRQIIPAAKPNGLWDRAKAALRPPGISPYEWVLFHNAAHLIAPSSFVARDLTENFGIPRDKITVAMCVPSRDEVDVCEADMEAVRRKYALPGRFVFFPSGIGPTKNQSGLIEAIGYALREWNVEIPVVLTGHTDNVVWPQVQKRIQELGLERTVLHLGFVPAREKWALFKLAQALVLPTLYESTSLPAWEALQAGCPVVATNRYDIPEQMGDAAYYFDPLDTADMAHAIKQVFCSSEIRESLRLRGERRLKELGQKWRERFVQAWLQALIQPCRELH